MTALGLGVMLPSPSLAQPSTPGDRSVSAAQGDAPSAAASNDDTSNDDANRAPRDDRSTDGPDDDASHGGAEVMTSAGPRGGVPNSLSPRAVSLDSLAPDEESEHREDGDDEAAASRIPGPDYLRAFLMDVAMLAGGTIWYWLDDRNVLDWDFDSWDQRFSAEAYRFDNNEFPINFIGHPLSGAAYYGVPRANRLGIGTSFLFGALTSFIWEFFLEFQERFSLNDIIATPIGGLPIGEGFIRLARWLDNRAHPALAWTLGLPIALFELMDGRAVGLDGPGTADEDPGFAEVLVDYGASVVVPGGDTAGPAFDVQRIGARARFVALESYRHAGVGIEGFYDAEVSEIRMDGMVSTTGAGFELEADAMVAGAHIRSLVDRGGGRLFGTSALVGTSISHFYRFENYDPWHERLSYTGFPGLALDLEEHLDTFRMSFYVRAQAVFGASDAANELPQWIAAHPDAVSKSILPRHGYWYGWGWMTRAWLELAIEPVRIAGTGRYLVLDSQESYDRNEELVTQDADGFGQLLETIVEARVDILRLIAIRARWIHQRRYSRLDEIDVTRSLDRFELSAGGAF